MLAEYQQVVIDREKHFSKYATKSFDCVGRMKPLSSDDHRTDFERDYHRILHSLPFRRLKHKTQVFFAPKNDHICARMEHAMHVATIASTICNHLNLNTDLAEAIALGHDLGHPPFGHTGEEVLNGIHKEYGLQGFLHEAQSLRIIDHFKDKAHNYTLNLTYEVRDGIVCHYGEGKEQSLKPDRSKNIQDVSPECARKQNPGTLEGCVVRMSDRIAYLGRDYEDAVEVGILQRILPENIEKTLGTTNSQIVGTLIRDVIQSSKNTPDTVQFSHELFPYYNELADFSIENIYKSDKITSQIKRISMMLSDLFKLFFEVIDRTRYDPAKRTDYNGGNIYRVFFEFLDGMEYPEETDNAQIISDFVSGMTDNFALRAFKDLFLVSSPA